MVLPRVPLLRSQKLLAAVNVSQIFYYGLTLSRLGCATPRFHFHVLVQEDFYLLVSLIVNVFSICLRVESDVLSFDVGAHNEYMKNVASSWIFTQRIGHILSLCPHYSIDFTHYEAPGWSYTSAIRL